jgi:hypothetical protein
MTRVAELFADVTMALEDMHPVACAGQRRGTSPDRSRALVGDLRAGMVRLDTILAEITACLGAAS